MASPVYPRLPHAGVESEMEFCQKQVRFESIEKRSFPSLSALAQKTTPTAQHSPPLEPFNKVCDFITARGMRDAFLTLQLPSSRSTFSQPFREKCISEVVRIGSIIIFHLSKG